MIFTHIVTGVFSNMPVEDDFHLSCGSIRAAMNVKDKLINDGIDVTSLIYRRKALHIDLCNTTNDVMVFCGGDVESELLDLVHRTNEACINIELIGTIRSEYLCGVDPAHNFNLGVFMANKVMNGVVDGEPSLVAMRHGAIPNNEVIFLPSVQIGLHHLALYQFRDNPITIF